MPGPGGGASGGGFGGGSFGGGSHGGGFGGSRRGGGYRPGFYPYYGGYYYRRGGCMGSLFGLLIAPIFILIMGLVMLFAFAGSVFNTCAGSGEVKYDEAAFQDYADSQYSEEFGSTTAYEDNLLIVFLTNEKADGYYTIAWVGDNIKRDISDLFGNEETVFGHAVQSSINQSYYAYSLDTNLASVMDTMTDAVTKMGLDSSFYTEESHEDAPTSHVTNHTELTITEATVDRALENFTDKTGIPTVIVIENVKNVFSASTSDVILIILAVGLVLLAIYLIVRIFKGRKMARENEPDDDYPNGNRRGY